MNFLEISKQYNLQYKFNILPLKDKAPVGDWQYWQTHNMSPEDICSFKWKNINGIGAISGISNLRCFDFDKVKDLSIVKKFLRSLGLPSGYAWTVISGSGNGYHIWFYCNDESHLYKILGGEKSYYNLKVKNENLCDHIELRWKNCQTALPPSNHPSGKVYTFANKNILPEKGPAYVPAGRLISTLELYCQLISEPKPVVQKIKQKSVTVDLGLISEMASYLQGRITNYDDWLHIGFALASIGEQGREFFLQISRDNPNYSDNEATLNKKFNGFIKDYRGSITIGSFFEIAKKYGFVKLDEYFWRSENGKVKIYSNLLIDFLEKEGFAKIIINKDYFFIRDKQNILSMVTKINIKDHVINAINKNSQPSVKGMLIEYLIKNLNTLCCESTFECLPTLDPEMIKTSKDKESFYFRNCLVEVTKDYIKQKDYGELSGKIWEKQMIARNFCFIQQRSEFQTFIENICRKNNDRINALKSSIGYLLVSYKDPSCAKAMIFTDEKLSDNAFGRSGKGLVAKAISHVKNVLRIDGKNFSFDKSFMFQSVDPDTQLLIFDDVKKKFSFDKLFSILTEGITIEKKNRNEYRMAFENSPKILITTNHTIEGSDDSSIDRQFVVEFSDYYNAQHKPVDEFGHLFFDEWDESQWNAFDLFMMECCKYFLKHGLKTYKYINLIKKKLIDSTAPEFEEFIKAVPLNKEVNKKELFDRFKEENEDFGQIKQNTLSKWTKVYADLYKLDITERKSGSERHIKFVAK